MWFVLYITINKFIYFNTKEKKKKKKVEKTFNFFYLHFSRSINFETFCTHIIFLIYTPLQTILKHQLKISINYETNKQSRKFNCDKFPPVILINLTSFRPLGQHNISSNCINRTWNWNLFAYNSPNSILNIPRSKFPKLAQKSFVSGMQNRFWHRSILLYDFPSWRKKIFQISRVDFSRLT